MSLGRLVGRGLGGESALLCSALLCSAQPPPLGPPDEGGERGKGV